MTLTRAGLEWSKRLRKTINQARSGLRERDCSNSQNQLKMSSELGKEREKPEWGHWGLRGEQERVQKGNNTKLDTKGKILRQYVCLDWILQSLNK